MGCKDEIIDALGRENAKHWDTLVTKIIGGVFVNVPAFDTYFCNNMKVYSFNKETLLKIKQFYQDNRIHLISSKFIPLTIPVEKWTYFTPEQNW